ncbi:MAG: hypothetical protein ACLSDQ_11570 [Adlercreutzia equolifaciens]
MPASPAQHHHRRAVAGRGHRVYPAGRHLRHLPELVQSVFADNCVAVVFAVAILASLLLPKDQLGGPLIVEEGNDSRISPDALES